MNIFKIITLSTGIALIPNAFSQEINWRGIDTNTRHFISGNFGADYSSYYGASYAYRITNKVLPLVVGSEYNISFGKQLVDDWKSKTSIQTELWHSNRFSLGLKSGFIVRRFDSEMARLVNLGADVTTVFAYSKPKWGIGVLANYDRSMSTHIRNKLLKEYYSGIVDGWYNTHGGNFKFGIRANYTIGQWNAFLNLGKAYGQNFKDNPTLPFYADISIQRQF
jgi:hypothetical protein